MMGESDPRRKAVRREATHLETPEEIEQALIALRQAELVTPPPKPGLQPSKPVVPPYVPAAPTVPAQPQIISSKPLSPVSAKVVAQAGTEVAPTLPFRPISRPGMAILTICDDGTDHGAVIRLRSDRFIIGRNQGDFQIPHDARISSTHLAIVREMDGNKATWSIRDLDSKNGTFMRVKSRTLRNGSEFLIGHARFEFGLPGETDHETPTVPKVDTSATMDWMNQSGNMVGPTLTEIGQHGPLRQISLSRQELILGADPALCQVTVQDPFVCPKHARVYFDPAKGRWMVQNLNSLNGTWIRIDDFEVESACHFQLGEQRFLLRVL